MTSTLSTKKALLLLSILTLSGPLIDGQKQVSDENLTAFRDLLKDGDTEAAKKLAEDKKIPVIRTPVEWEPVMPKVIGAVTQDPNRLNKLLEALDANASAEQLLEQLGVNETAPSSASSGQKVDAQSDEATFKLKKGEVIVSVSEKIASYGGAFVADDQEGKPTISAEPVVVQRSAKVSRWLSDDHLREWSEEEASAWKAEQKKG